MSGKLDQSLDQIMSDRKDSAKQNGGGRRRGARGRTGAKPVAPAGGIQKTGKVGKVGKATKTVSSQPRAAAVPAPAVKSAKIMVGGLPTDVSEKLVKDFFNQTVGPTKQVLLSYNANGQSRGEATVLFFKPMHAKKAHQKFHNVLVDDRRMKVEIIGVDPETVVAKALKDRIVKPKVAEKTDKKATKANTSKEAATKGAATQKKAKGKKAGNTSRPKPKTAAELDAEMDDYWVPSNGAATSVAAAAAAAPATTEGDAGMADEVM